MTKLERLRFEHQWWSDKAIHLTNEFCKKMELLSRLQLYVFLFVFLLLFAEPWVLFVCGVSYQAILLVAGELIEKEYKKKHKRTTEKANKYFRRFIRTVKQF